jgi:hypothetical protein
MITNGHISSIPGQPLLRVERSQVPGIPRTMANGTVKTSLSAAATSFPHQKTPQPSLLSDCVSLLLLLREEEDRPSIITFATLQEHQTPCTTAENAIAISFLHITFST